MTKSFSIVCALITTFIWGTAFIAQDTGMDNIGPLTFNAARFFVGFITVLPIAFSGGARGMLRIALRMLPQAAGCRAVYAVQLYSN